MHRRRFLQVLGALGATVPMGPSFAAERRRIVVVGAGIVGASVAYHLARRGADVTVAEKAKPGAGTTGRSFAWVNAHFSKKPRHYHLLSQLGVAAHARLERELGEAGLLEWRGAIEWYGDERNAAMLRAEVKAMQEWGDTVRLIHPAEFASLESGLRPGSVLAAAFAEQDGGVDPVRLTEVLLRRARSSGAQVVHPCEVTGLELRGGRLRAVRTTRGDMAADCVVVACGVDTPRVASFAGLAVPLRHAPGILAWTTPQPRLVNRVLVGPGVHFRQLADGRVLIGEDDGPPPTPTHAHLASGPQDFPTDGFQALHGAQLLRMGSRFLPALADAAVHETKLGWRPMPTDGWPVVGFAASAPDVYVAVTHSGVTLGPLLGQLAASEILDGVRVDLLAPYRLERFARPSAGGPPVSPARASA